MPRPRRQVEEAERALEEERGEKSSLFWQITKWGASTQAHSQSISTQKTQLEKFNENLLLSLLIKGIEKDYQNKIVDLEERLQRIETAFQKITQVVDFNDEKQLNEIINSSPALKHFSQTRKMSLPSKRILIKNREKFEKLYKESGLKRNLESFAGILKINDKESVHKLFE